MTENDNKDLNRTSRSADTRAKKEARKPWSPPSLLDTPPAPEGYTYRWIRAETLGVEDHKNLTARLSEGFDLVRAEELDDSQQDRYDTLKQGRHSGVVSRGGLLLAKIPNETREERNSYYASRAKTQQDAVDNDMMKESDPSSPMLNPQRSSKVTFGGGQRS
tara:strand:- start:1051 stop:1536 length:486 start_codon:yes stop_codon:yes gene_type:complete